MIVGDAEWQQRALCESQKSKDGEPPPLCRQCKDGNSGACDRYWKTIGGTGKYYAANPDVWKMANRGEVSKLSHEAVSLIEIMTAMDWLKGEDYQAWACLSHTSFAKPTALGGHGHWSNERAAAYLDISEAQVRRKCRTGLQLMAGRILDEIAPATLKQLGRT